MALELRQVQVRPGSTVQQLARVVEEPDPEVEQAGADRLAVHENVSLRQVPAARADAERRDRVVERVRLLVALKGEASADGFGDGPVAGHDVGPGGGEGIFEVGHEHRCAAVQGVDHHLRLRRAGDLDTPVVEVRRRGGDAPARVAALDRVREEIRHLARIESLLTPSAVGEQPLAFGVERPMQLRDEPEGLGSQNLLGMGCISAGELDTGERLGHARSVLCDALARRSMGPTVRVRTA